VGEDRGSGVASRAARDSSGEIQGSGSDGLACGIPDCDEQAFADTVGSGPAGLV
jgi:hypothetical protein